MIKNVNSTSSMDQSIDSIRMCESDRQIAKQHMHDADIVADLFYHAVENLRSGRKVLASRFLQRARTGTSKLIDQPKSPSGA